MYRSHVIGEITPDFISKEVTICGWVHRIRDHGGVYFCDLRDTSGIIQVLVNDSSALENKIRLEYLLQVRGRIVARAKENINPELANGSIELEATDIEVLSSSDPLPFTVSTYDGSTNVQDDIRLKYRYLDLRRPLAQSALKLRSKINRIARETLYELGFVEIETPTLTRSTPEGARDFLVPARLSPGNWYALPQSPQLFKQLLMVAGLERYFQIARCYRDEDFRADRQPEFTQLDIEASFVNQDDVIRIAEKIVKEIFQVIGVQVPTPIRQITYDEAMSTYGSDKPDLRYGLPLVDLTEYFSSTEFRIFQAQYVGAIVMPKGASQSRRTFDAWQKWAKTLGAKGLAYIIVAEDGSLQGPVAKNLSATELEGLVTATGANPGDCIFFAAGAKAKSQQFLGKVRNEIANRLGLVDDSQWSFVWVVDAPLFTLATQAKDDGDVVLGQSNWTSLHHPFTSPTSDCIDSFDTDPASAKAYAYDIVCNGNEIGGGSIRIHDPKVQQRVFDVLGIDERTAKDRFGFLLDAFRFAAPPHGGLAFGWDRICALLCGVKSIREVIAFPKTGGGFDPLTGAPAPIDEKQRLESGVDYQPEEDEK